MSARRATLGALLAALHAVAADDDARRSGFDFMSAPIQALQRDDTQNPGMLWVSEGEELWHRRVGANNRSCAGCHGDATVSMRGVAAGYPAYDVLQGRAVDLGGRIQLCRQRNQGLASLPVESRELLSLQSYVAFQSRGLPMEPPFDPRLDAPRERGRQLFFKRIGQLDLACTQCHDANAGRRLGGSVIPQAHATGYPSYRLEWQGMGSLQRRARSCMSGVRAEPYAYGAEELVELELYLALRDQGMAVETPSVRP